MKPRLTPETPAPMYGTFDYAQYAWHYRIYELSLAVSYGLILSCILWFVVPSALWIYDGASWPPYVSVYLISFGCLVLGAVVHIVAGAWDEVSHREYIEYLRSKYETQAPTQPRF